MPKPPRGGTRPTASQCRPGALTRRHHMIPKPDNQASVRGTPSVGASVEPPARRLRRLHQVWPDRDGNISYLLTLCVDERLQVLDNEETFQRLVSFLLDSPQRYHWFGRRFVLMPDHLHLIAHQGHEAVVLGRWVKALKAVVGGLREGDQRPVGAPGLQADVGAASGDAVVRGVPAGRDPAHPFIRIRRSWRWQPGFHDHKFRTRESEARKWEYVCLNPVRCHLVQRPEDWRYGGEIFYDEPGGPRIIRGSPPLLEAGILIEEDGTRVGRGTGSRNEGTPGPPRGSTQNPPRGGTRPTA